MPSRRWTLKSLLLAAHHGFLWIQDVLVVTWPQVRPLSRPSAQQHTNVKWLNQQVWQRKWNSRFLARNRVATRPYREKKQQQSRVLFRLSFNLYTWRGWTDKELEREIKNKGDEFCWKNNMKILYRRWEKEKPARWKWAAVKKKWCKVVFLLLLRRLIIFPFSLPSPFSIAQFYVLLE